MFTCESRWCGWLGARLLLVLALTARDARSQSPAPGDVSTPVSALASAATLIRDATGQVTLRAVRIASPITLDGRLDEAVYTAIPAASEFVQQEPKEGEPATERTEAWIFFDDRNIYVA